MVSSSVSGAVADSRDPIVRKYRGILNKLTCDNSEKLFIDLGELIQSNPQCITIFADELFEKTCGDVEYSGIYATFSSYLSRKPGLFENLNIEAFLHRFVGHCQAQFEKRLVQKEHRTCTSNVVNFIGRLYRAKVINDAVFHTCLQDLLHTKEEKGLPEQLKLDLIETDLTYFCKLMEMNGELIDQSIVGRDLVDQYMTRAISLLNRYKIQPRVRFALQNLEERRSNKWAGRKPKSAASNVSEIEHHQRTVGSRQALSNGMESQPSSNGGVGPRSKQHGPDGALQAGQRRMPGRGFPPSRPGLPLLSDLPRRAAGRTPTAILKRGMEEQEILACLTDDADRLAININNIQNSNEQDDLSVEAEIDKEIEVFLTSPDKRFTSAINNVKKTIFAHGHAAYFTYAIAKHSLSFGTSVVKPVVCLLKELVAANVLNCSVCEEGITRILFELPVLEARFSCVKSHVAVLTSLMYKTKSLDVPNLLRAFCTPQWSPTVRDNDPSNDSVMQFLLILLQNINQQEESGEALIGIIRDCVRAEPKWLIRFDQWSRGCAESSTILANRGLEILQPFLCLPESIQGHIEAIHTGNAGVQGICQCRDIPKPDIFLNRFFDCLHAFVASKNLAIDEIKAIVESTIDVDARCINVLDQMINSTPGDPSSWKSIRKACLA